MSYALHRWHFRIVAPTVVPPIMDLPVARVKTAPKTRHDEIAALRRALWRPPKCLLVEDNQYDLLVLTSLLKELECDVFISVDGESGLDLARRSPFDIILCNLSLPSLSGFEFIKQCRQFQPAAPVVIVTGYDNVEFRQEALQLGILYFFVKPFTLENLKRLLTDLGFVKVDYEQAGQRACGASTANAGKTGD